MQKKRSFILVIIISNLLFAMILFNQFYYKKASFDTSKKPTIVEIKSVSNGDGSWTWKRRKFDFYKDFSINLDKTEITQFCVIVNSSHAKYIENIRPEEWFDIYLVDKNGKEIQLTLKRNDEGVFFEIDHEAFEGNLLSKYLENKIRKNH
jgi:hypothetical protein